MNSIETKKAPAAIGPYSQAIELNGLLYCSGQIGLDPVSMHLVEGIERQTEQAFKNLEAVIESAGGTLQSVVKLTLYLTNLDHFESVNAWMKTLWQPPYPARVTLGVSALPRGALIEVEAMAQL